jgi:CheY-like chemotaxis protein
MCAEQHDGSSAAPILVIEDHPQTREALVTVLELAGLTVQAVANADDGLKLLQKDGFALVVADYLLGAMNEAESQARRLLEAAAPVPVGCVTGWTIPDALEGQFAFVLTKPFSAEDLIAEVGRIIAGQEGDSARTSAVRAYFQRLSQGDAGGVAALCTETVRYCLPADPPAGGVVVEGRDAFRRYTAEVFGSFGRVAITPSGIWSLPRGMVARYDARWATPAGVPAHQRGAVLFQFEGERIAQIGVRLDLRTLSTLAGGSV